MMRTRSHGSRWASLLVEPVITHLCGPWRCTTMVRSSEARFLQRMREVQVQDVGSPRYARLPIVISYV